MEIVQSEGKREVVREVELYNLDAIIAVGYRVNSYQATQFRIWATNTLREFLILNENGDDTSAGLLIKDRPSYRQFDLMRRAGEVEHLPPAEREAALEHHEELQVLKCIVRSLPPRRPDRGPADHPDPRSGPASRSRAPETRHAHRSDQTYR